MGAVSYQLLDRQLYSIAQAADLLGMPASTLRYWLQGREQPDRPPYLPVLRDDLNDDDAVRWGEFIEAAVLRHLRTKRKSMMHELRLCRLEMLRDHPERRYPFAHGNLYMKGSRVVLQDLKGYWEPATRTQLDESAVRLFVEEVDWREYLPVGWHPRRSTHPSVTLDPERRFGMPSVGGIRTQTVFDLVEAGEDPAELTKDLGLTEAQLSDALAYERERRGLLQAA